MLSPLINLVRECGYTKVTMAYKAKQKPWHWDSMHQTANDIVKAAIAKDVILAYPKEFKVYTNNSVSTWCCHHSNQ